MALTPAQLTTFKAAILAETDPTLVAARDGGSNTGIRDWYNLTASPDYFIFRNLVTSTEIRLAINLQDIADITTADRERVDTLLMLREVEGYSGAVASDRSAWDDVFSAAAGDASQQAIAALWTRVATNAEKVFSLSTGSGVDAANADTTDFQGDVSLQDVRDALAS